MDDVAKAVQALRELFVAHAAKEEANMQTIDVNVQKQTEAISASTNAQMRLAAVLEAREAREVEDRKKAAELDLVRAKQQATAQGWWRKQWEKYGTIVLIVAIAVVAPSVLPVVLNSLGLTAPQRVVVEQPAPETTKAPLPTPEPPTIAP